MGYDTQYDGALYFSNLEDISVEKLRYLKSILGEDYRDHKEWHSFLPEKTYLTYIDFKLLDDFSGIEHTGAEKSHDQVDALNLIKALMEVKFGKPFRLEGRILCQGEDIEDRWFLIMGDDGVAYRLDIEIGTLITCPECGHRFELGS